MNGDALQEIARARAEELPAAEATRPFGPDYDVFKVMGKMFLLFTEVRGEQIVVLKADPRDSEALRQAHPNITPGYHMNKRHWISLAPGGELNGDLIRELVTESYLLVVEGLPRAQRPVDPGSFGARSGGAPSP
ncbi:MmcQ/YjbR family DNA-binding protein [Brachybacterium paraconglomeratum]|uniref:MmcQ/YjbR family DNA-binding protein n=1 Tax=Brachybacterium paraconglomeratum TaxID=173362 RepID=UPI0031E6E5A1